jgi:hypothetical protein
MSGHSRRIRMRCYACHRDDVHVRVRLHRAESLLLKILTLGIANLVWPYRCSTCGHRRPLYERAAALLDKLMYQ